MNASSDPRTRKPGGTPISRKPSGVPGTSTSPRHWSDASARARSVVARAVARGRTIHCCELSSLGYVTRCLRSKRSDHWSYVCATDSGREKDLGVRWFHDPDGSGRTFDRVRPYGPLLPSFGCDSPFHRESPLRSSMGRPGGRSALQHLLRAGICPEPLWKAFNRSPSCLK